ncbi:MAG: response regulator [Bacillota bacterium]|nr:response regulator [Bacillota bacterium]
MTNEATSGPVQTAAAIDLVAIDDDESIRWLFTELFTLSGIRHCVAPSGAEGLRLVAQHRPRLVIADVKLGGMNGLEVAERISRISPSTRVILITGYGERVRSRLNEAPGIMLVLEKPFDINHLLDLVRGALAEPA